VQPAKRGVKLRPPHVIKHQTSVTRAATDSFSKDRFLGAPENKGGLATTDAPSMPTDVSRDVLEAVGRRTEIPTRR
jgi:hypothetical protein